MVHTCSGTRVTYVAYVLEILTTLVVILVCHYINMYSRMHYFTIGTNHSRNLSIQYLYSTIINDISYTTSPIVHVHTIELPKYLSLLSM